MSAAQIDPHDTMRSRDVNKVARGEQAPRPVHEPGTVSRPPPPSQVDEELKKKRKERSHRQSNKDIEEGNEDDGGDVMENKTAPADIRFPFSNQTRHCYARYLEYHKCIKEKGENAPECEKFARLKGGMNKELKGHFRAQYKCVTISVRIGRLKGI